MIYPPTTFSGQEVTICNRYIKLFMDEAGSHPSGVEARALRAELNALMPEAYHGYRLVWLRIKWNEVLNGNAELGFPGVDLDKRSLATEKKDEVYQALKVFYKYQREESKPTIKALLRERHKAMERCRQDGFHNPTLSNFKRINGKLVLDLPSKNPMNESTNIAFAMRAMETLDSSMDNEHRQAIGGALADMKQKGYDNIRWDEKIDKELVRININLPEPPDPPEDFTTYTEVDAFGNVTITSTTITGIGITRNEETYVYKNRASNPISGNFSHLVDTNVTNGDSVFGSWSLTNDIGNIVSLRAASKNFLHIQHNTGTSYILFEEYLGTSYFDSILGLTSGQTYYLTIDRDKDVGSFGQLTCLINSDTDRTIFVDILSVLLHADLDYENIFGLMSHDDNNAGAGNITVSNLDLQEAIAAGRRRKLLIGGRA